MGFRARIVGRAKRIADRFSGEFSDPAPDEVQPYERPGTPDENAEVVMAKLKGNAVKLLQLLSSSAVRDARPLSSGSAVKALQLRRSSLVSAVRPLSSGSVVKAGQRVR